MEKIEQQVIVPKERRQQNTAKGEFDEHGFFRTPNGSFWDPDGEYFNHYGYDVHSGFYTKEGEYIPGPDWLSDLGCYEDEKHKYENFNEDIFAGEDKEDLIVPDELIEDEYYQEKPLKKSKKQKKNKKIKKSEEEELSEGWETDEENEI